MAEAAGFPTRDSPRGKRKRRDTNEEQRNLKKSLLDIERGDTDPEQNDTMTPHLVSRSSPSLLGLPAELRNCIYEHLLLDRAAIVIDETLQEPALLQTNRQVRSESRPMWYLRNQFRIVIQDCDADLLLRWTKLAAPLGDSTPPFKGPQPKVSIGFEGKCNWANLMQWCRSPHHSPCMRGIESKTERSPTQKVAFAAWAMARSNRNLSWRTCMNNMAILRRVFGEIDKAWLEGDDGPE